MSRARRPDAALIVNPNAGRLPERVRADVIAELASHFKLEVFTTTARDAGIGIASDAVAEGIDLVIAFGGDGHVNEVANGVAGTSASMGIIPGGTMNVFARALGVPLDPLDAVDHLNQMRGSPRRVVPLGKMDDRYFTFSAGCGFDAETAERVERHLASKRRFGEMFFYWSAFRVLAGSFRHRAPTMTLSGGFGKVDVAMAIACNTGPYAYLLGRPVNVTPKVRLEGGIDIFALKNMRIEALPLYMWGVAKAGDLTGHPDAFYETDLDGFELESEEPFHRHVDGEPLPAARSARFAIEKDILRVCA